MTIEQIITDNTAAILENTAVLKATLAHLCGGGASVDTSDGAVITAKSIVTPAENAKPAKASKAKAEKIAKVETPVLAQKDVSDKIIKLAQTKGREVAVAVLKDFGVSLVSQLKPDQYAAVIEAVDQALEEKAAETADPTASLI